MAQPEVIELSDESDEDVQVVGVGTAVRPLPRLRRRNYNNGPNDDEVIEVPGNQRDTAHQVIHAPDGQIVVPGLQPTPEPPRASFENTNTAEARRRFAPPRTRHQVQRYHPEVQRNLRRPVPPANRHRETARQQQLAGLNRVQQRQAQARAFGINDMVQLVLQSGVGQLYQPFHMQFGLGDLSDFTDEDEDEDPDFNPATDRFFFHNNNDEIPAHIMEEIQRRENADFDRQKAGFLSRTEPIRAQMFQKAESLKYPYTSHIEEEKEYVCTLCGTTLGGGIPDDFEIIRKQVPLQLLQEQNDVQAPYQALNLVTVADRDLSKRIFMAKCGHTYCGRCVKNISNIKSTVKEKRKKPNKNDISISNPLIYAPLKCVASGCSSRFSGKTTFTEIFT